MNTKDKNREFTPVFFIFQQAIIIIFLSLAAPGLAQSEIRTYDTPKYDRKKHNLYNSDKTRHTKKYVKSDHDTYNKRGKKVWSKHTRKHTKKYYTKYKKYAKYVRK